MNDLPEPPSWDELPLPDDPFPADLFSELPYMDAPPLEALDELLQTATEMGGVVTELPQPVPASEERSAFKALSEIGIAADGADLDQDPPPFFDEETNTAYWIGVFQPDSQNPDNCIASILSVGRAAEGDLEAQLAPCVPGDWNKAYGACEYLLSVMERGGIEPCFVAAEAMALASDQREFWEQERGIRLEPEVAESIANYTHDEWDIEL